MEVKTKRQVVYTNKWVETIDVKIQNKNWQRSWEINFFMSDNDMANELDDVIYKFVRNLTDDFMYCYGGGFGDTPGTRQTYQGLCVPVKTKFLKKHGGRVDCVDLAYKHQVKELLDYLKTKNVKLVIYNEDLKELQFAK